MALDVVQADTAAPADAAWSEAALAPALLQAMSEAVYVVDRSRTIRYWNPAAEKLTGFPAADVVGRRCRDGILDHVDDNGTLLCRTRCPLLATMRDGRPTQISAFLHHRDGHRVPVVVSAAALLDAGGRVRGTVETFHDDSRCRGIAGQLEVAENASLTDPLTGLWNRRMLLRELQRYHSDHGRYGRLFAVLFADVDHFKNVNDQFGHDVGDKVLKLVAATLSGCLRANDTVGRWGGEEFLVLAQVADQQQAMALGERLRKLVASAWIDADGARISVTLSIGVAVIGTGESAHTLVDRADTAMFTAKIAGRNRTALG